MVAFVQARNYHRGRIRKPRLIIIHTMEYPERSNGAEWCAGYFSADGAPKASAHYAVDADTVIGMVRETDTAWAAPGANADGIQYEHAGFAGQCPKGWADDYSQAMLRLSASAAAASAARWGIPLRRLSNVQLASGYPGFVGHNQVSQVFRLSSHWDPGPAFPWGQYMRLVEAAQLGRAVPPPKRGPTEPRGPFPLPDGHWYGVDDGTLLSHSGYRAADRFAIGLIQAKLGHPQTGRYRGALHTAVSGWQAQHGLPVDGKVGAQTWASM